MQNATVYQPMQQKMDILYKHKAQAAQHRCIPTDPGVVQGMGSHRLQRRNGLLTPLGLC